RCQLALSRYFQPGLAAELPAHGICANGLGLPFDLEVAQVLEYEESVPKVLSPSTGYDLARLGDREKSGREAGGIADCRVVHAEVAADGADDHGARVEPHPHPEVDPVGPLHVVGERLEVVLDRERRAQRALSVVLVSDRRTEKRHHAIAEELVDRALVTVNRIQDDLEGAVHDPVDVLGIELLRHRRESRHVREHHGDDLPLALAGAFGGEDLLGEVFGWVGLRGGEAGGRRRRGRHGGRGRRCRCGPRQPLAALATKFVGRRVGGLASRAERLEPRPALPAELGPRRVRVPALGTFHPYYPCSEPNGYTLNRQKDRP